MRFIKFSPFSRFTVDESGKGFAAAVVTIMRGYALARSVRTSVTQDALGLHIALINSVRRKSRGKIFEVFRQAVAAREFFDNNTRNFYILGSW